MCVMDDDDVECGMKFVMIVVLVLLLCVEWCVLLCEDDGCGWV